MAGEVILQLDFQPLVSGADNERIPSVSFNDSPPKAGQWDAGDRVYNSNPVTGGAAGWICITAGCPGIWTTFPEIIP